MYETQKKRRIRRPAAWLLAVLLTGVLCCQAVWADQRTLIPVGKAVGIKLFADGVLVVSTSETDPCPARDCGIREGDLIVSCNGEKVTSTEDLQALLQAKALRLRLIRQWAPQVKTSVRPRLRRRSTPAAMVRAALTKAEFV